MLHFLKIIIYVLLFLLPTAQLVRDWKYADKRTLTHSRVTHMILVAYILLVIPSAIFLWMDARDSSQTQNKINNLITGNDSILQENGRLRSEIHDLQEQVNKSFQQQIAAERILRLKSDKIAELNSQIAASVTGGNGFCYITVSIGNDPYQGTIMLVHPGKYPLYDINIRIVDLQKIKKIDKSSPQYLNAHLGKTQGPFILSPESALLLGQWNYENRDVESLNIFFSARNGFFTQLLRRILTNGQWKEAIRVTRRDEGNVLFEQVDQGFPRDSKGQVNWD